jgi:hypothetical protein
MLGESFHWWKGDLNIKYVQKGLTPFLDYRDITPAQWEEFVRQKISEEALALSQRNRDLALSNIHKVYLGLRRYQRKVNQWRREREAAIATGQPNPFEGFDERGYF